MKESPHICGGEKVWDPAVLGAVWNSPVYGLQARQWTSSLEMSFSCQRQEWQLLEVQGLIGKWSFSKDIPAHLHKTRMVGGAAMIIKPISVIVWMRLGYFSGLFWVSLIGGGKAETRARTSDSMCSTLLRCVCILIWLLSVSYRPRLEAMDLVMLSFGIIS